MRSLIFVSLFFCHFLQASFYDRAMEGRYWYDEKTSEDDTQKPIVVITGISGYIGSQVAAFFLRDGGFKIIGTLREQNKSKKIENLQKAFHKLNLPFE